MLSLKCEFAVENKLFPFVKEATLKSTKESIADILTVKLPKYKKLKIGELKEGDRVKLKAGYNEYGIYTEFEGFVSKVSPNQPYTVECHDWFGELKKSVVTKYFRKISSKDIISQLLADFDIDLSNVQTGKHWTRCGFYRRNLRWILSYIAKRSNYDVYFRGNKLFFCPKWDESKKQNEVYAFERGRNVIDDSEISFNTNPIYDKVTVISEKTDGTGKITKVSAGSGSKEKKLYLEDLEYKEAREIAKTKLKEFNYRGFKGTFETFGYPGVLHSQKIKFIDSDYPEKTGYYKISSVEKTIGTNGFRQKITLQEKE